MLPSVIQCVEEPLGEGEYTGTCVGKVTLFNSNAYRCVCVEELVTGRILTRYEYVESDDPASLVGG